MTDSERVSIIDYMREQFREVKDHLSAIEHRLEALESDRTARDGRNRFIANTAKSVAGAVATVLAALGIKSQIS